jgi:PAS domain S-box-containing protein
MGKTNRALVPSELNVVLIEDDDADAERIVGELVSAGFTVNAVRATSRAQVRAAVTGVEGVDAVLCAYIGRGVKVRQALEVMKASGATAPLIVVSRGLTDEKAAEFIRLGAKDYIPKDRLGRLPHALTQAIDHARAARAGHELEQRYRLLFENLPMAVFRVTAEGRITHANPAALGMFGFADLASLLARPALDFYVEPDDRKALLARLQMEGDVPDFECAMRRADGTEFWFSRGVHAVREEDGQVVGWESIGRNSTEARDAMRRVRESETYLRAVIETAPDAVIGMDESGFITDWNSAAQETFGWMRAEVMGRSVSKTIIPPELRDRHERGMASFHRDGSTKMIGHRWDTLDGLRKNGEVFPIELAVTPPIPLGETKQFVAFARDISERKEAGLELAESQERLASLLSGAPVAIATLDTDGRFTFAGGSVFSQLGLDPSSIVGLLVTEALGDRPDFLEFWTTALERDLQTDMEFSGRTFHLHCGPLRLTPQGEVIGVRAVALDITERVEADRALRQSEEVFRVLFEQSAVGISLTEVPHDGLPGRPPRWNNRIREILGVEGSPDQSRWQSLVTEDEQKDIDGKFSRLLSGEIAQLRERRMVTRPDGKTVWVDWSTVIVRDRDQQPLRLQTMVLDVSEQVEAEHRLSRRLTQQVVLLELSRAGLESSDTAAFLATAAVLVARGTETQFATILEVRPSDQSLICVASHGFSETTSPDQASLDGSSLILAALPTEMPVVLFDWQAQPEVRRSRWIIESGVVASMGVGIRGPGSPFGTVVVHSNVAREFSAEDLQFMQLASTIVSRVVERNRGEIQRQMLLGRVVSVQEEERKAIAEDIHDDAVQVMTAANMRLELFRMGLTDPAQVDSAGKLQETISLAIGRLRNLLFELVPPDLDRHGLAAALRAHLEQFESDAGIRWELHSQLTAELSPQVRILLFRIFQEALVNVRKHAHATTVRVSLKTVDGGAMMRLSDDGAGFQAASAEHFAGHLGLVSMRERAEIAGGWLRVTSEPGRGTEIRTWVPAAHNDEAAAANATALTAVG